MRDPPKGAARRWQGQGETPVCPGLGLVALARCHTLPLPSVVLTQLESLF